MTTKLTPVHDEARGHHERHAAAPASPGRMAAAEAIKWLREIAEVSLRGATLSTQRDGARTHCRRAKAAKAGAAALEEADVFRAIELAALGLLRACGPDASWGEHETAERVLRDLLKARGHDVGEATA